MSTVVVDPPVRGTWGIYNPPGHPRLAFDLLAEDENRSLYRRGTFLRHLTRVVSVENTYAWASPVLAPVDGVVVASHDGEADRAKISFVVDLVSLLVRRPKVSAGFGAFGGNHVMIRRDDCYVLLCHLRQGSISVACGEAVEAGQRLAEVGNSGSSIQPHLHMQVMSDDRYFPLFANLLPFGFSRGRIWQGQGWREQKAFVPRSGAHYAF